MRPRVVLVDPPLRPRLALPAERPRVPLVAIVLLAAALMVLAGAVL